MIKYVTGINDNYVLSFRLLNSEIGNDLNLKLFPVISIKLEFSSP